MNNYMAGMSEHNQHISDLRYDGYKYLQRWKINSITHVYETVRTYHKEASLVSPILVLVALFFWGSSQSLPAIIGISALTLIGILGSILSVVRRANVLAHRPSEPYRSLILSLSVVILEVSLISILVATDDAAPTLMCDTLYSIITIVVDGLVDFSLLLGGCKLATQYINLFGIKQYLITLFPLATIVPMFPMALSDTSFTTAQALLAALISAAMYGVFSLIQTETRQSLFIYEHEDGGDDDDPHHGKSSVHSNMRYAAWLIIHLIAVIAMAKMNASPLEALLIELNAPVTFTGFLVASLVLSPEGLDALKAVLSNWAQRVMNLLFGSVLATTSLTIPVATLITWVTGNDLVFTLDTPEMIMMVSSLVLCRIPFSTGHVDVLNDVARLALFITYLTMTFV